MWAERKEERLHKFLGCFAPECIVFTFFVCSKRSVTKCRSYLKWSVYSLGRPNTPKTPVYHGKYPQPLISWKSTNPSQQINRFKSNISPILIKSITLRTIVLHPLSCLLLWRFPLELSRANKNVSRACHWNFASEIRRTQCKTKLSSSSALRTNRHRDRKPQRPPELSAKQYDGRNMEAKSRSHSWVDLSVPIVWRWFQLLCPVGAEVW